MISKSNNVNDRLLRRQSVVPFTFFLLLLLGASLKDDFGSLQDSSMWSELSIHPAVALLKNNSNIFLAGAGLIAVYVIGKNRSASPRISILTIALISLTGISCLWAIYVDTDAAIKLAQASFIYIFIAITAGFLRTKFGPYDFNRVLADSFFWFATLLVIVNFSSLSLGFGFVPGNVRFFGTTTHPNFIGVQLAICNIALLAHAIFQNSRSRRSKIFSYLLLAIGLYAQGATGSRTSFAMLLTGTTLLFLARRQYKIGISLLLPLFAVVSVFAFLTFSPDVADGAFQRGIDGDTNTRKEAWLSMIHLISENPWLGKGSFVGYSENSYLRAMTAFGVPYSVILIITFSLIFKRHFRNSKFAALPNPPHSHLFLALMGALLIGGLFEGYLIDSWSLPKLVLLLLSISAFRINPLSKTVNRDEQALPTRAERV